MFFVIEKLSVYLSWHHIFRLKEDEENAFFIKIH